MYKNSEGKDDEGRMVETTGKNQKRLHIGVHIWDIKKKKWTGASVRGWQGKAERKWIRDNNSQEAAPGVYRAGESGL